MRLGNKKKYKAEIFADERCKNTDENMTHIVIKNIINELTLHFENN